MSRRTRLPGETGFSLIELIVAMAVTLIVSGAIYGLIASGQTAFRREPELAERQQNIRIAMDLIQRDVLLAGQGIPWFGQAFTLNDDGAATGACVGGLNGCGLTIGTLGSDAAALRASGAGDSEVPDVLEIVAVEEQCPFYTVCLPNGPGAPLDAGPDLVVREPLDVNLLACMQSTAPSLLVATNNYNWAILTAAAGVGGGTCGGANRSFAIGPPLGTWTPILGGFPLALESNAGGGGAWVSQARIARYEIAPDPLDNAPSLWRSTTGLYDAGGAPAGSAGAGVGTWQLVARGIEDMQVEYLDGNGGGVTWTNQPTLVGGGVACANVRPTPSLCPADALNITRQVRVTLSARSMAPNIQGAVLDGNQAAGSEALRGQLVTVITPRAAKVGLVIP